LDTLTCREFSHVVRVNLGVFYVAWLNHANGFEEIRVLTGLLLGITAESRDIVIYFDMLLEVSHQLLTVEVLREVEFELLGILSLPSSTDEELFVILDEIAMRE
jgi:hypothetical protein